MTNRNAYRCSANLAAQPIWQSGSLANLAIWRLSQSGKSIRSPEWAIWRLSQSGNLVLHPIWCNLAMSPIWPTWYESQSGNLADGPIWHEHTKLIILMSFLRKIPAPKTRDLNFTETAGCQIEPPKRFYARLERSGRVPDWK